MSILKKLTKIKLNSNDDKISSVGITEILSKYI